MYAVIKTGGKQYLVKPGQKLCVEKLDAAKDDVVTFPVILHKAEEKDATLETTNILVKATVLDQIRGPKIVTIKSRRRKHYRRTMGHRQYYSSIMIDSIGG